MIYYIKMSTEDFYKDVKDHLDKFDMNGYPQDSNFNTPQVNKQVAEKLKDQSKGKIMEEIFGFKLKMYIIQFSDIETRKTKNNSKNHSRNKMTFDDYIQRLHDRIKIFRTTFWNYKRAVHRKRKENCI